jgi:hypothetical protein
MTETTNKPKLPDEPDPGSGVCVPDDGHERSSSTSQTSTQKPTDGN